MIAPGMLLFRDNRYFTSGLFADGLGGDFGMAAQSQVNEVAFGGGQRLENLAADGLGSLAGHAISHLARLAFAAGPVAFRVHNHPLFCKGKMLRLWIAISILLAQKEL